MATGKAESVTRAERVSEARSVSEASSTGTAGAVNTDARTAEQTNEHQSAPHFKVPRVELPADHPQVVGATAPAPHGDELKRRRVKRSK
jgi:hypothetical protein